jgi:hypothetical protein
MVHLDLPRQPLDLARDVVERLRDAAAAMAGRSSAARDLGLLLERALEGGRQVALRRGETKTLLEVARAAGLFEVVARVSASQV